MDRTLRYGRRDLGSTPRRSTTLGSKAMLIKDFDGNELALLGKRVWNIRKTHQGTIDSINMEDRYPTAHIKWDHDAPDSCYFICNLKNELV